MQEDMVVKLWECFPKTNISQSLDAQPTTTPQTVDITFSYRYWTNLTSEQDFTKTITWYTTKSCFKLLIEPL